MQTTLDSFQLSPHLWVPQRRSIEQTIAMLNDGKRTLLYAPTGGGKTACSIELARWAQHEGLRTIFYANRKLLIGQTSKRFAEAGLSHGVRAADYDDLYYDAADVQIASSDTERSRVRSGKWPLFPADLVIVDEGHLQKTQYMDWCLRQYRERGAKIVIMTATPVEMGAWADDIVISGTLKEYRECKALVPAICKGITAVDLRKVKRNKTGEFVMDDRKRAIYTQSIVGDVIRFWKEFNPDARPTMMYAPGVQESIWLVQQFEKLGVRFAHVDATGAYLDGKRFNLSRAAWDDIISQYKDGRILGIGSRYRCREGIDLPTTYHVILATPIGSLASYIQTVGRALRYSPETPKHVIVTDHGGCYLNHGSPNVDRPWHRLWRLTEHQASKSHRQKIKDAEIKESIVCPQCRTERPTGITCPICGFTHKASSRRVVMESGAIVEHEGPLVPVPKRRLRSDTDAKWSSMYYGFARKRVNRTFAQMEAFFAYQHRYWPERNRPFMPKRKEDWCCRVCDVPMSDLYQPRDVR